MRLLLFTFFFTVVYANAFEINKVERDLINPVNTLEVTPYYNYTLESNEPNDLYISLRYSLTNKLEINLLGLNYLFYNGSQSDWLVGARYIGYQSETNKGTSQAVEFEFRGKNKLVDNVFALDYTTHYTYILNSHSTIDDGYMIDANIRPIIMFSDYFAFTLFAEYLYVNDKRTPINNRYQLGSSLNLAINKYIDIGLSYSYFENEKMRSPLFNPYNYDFTRERGYILGINVSVRSFF